MTVFNNYFKIVKSYIPTIIIYTVIFVMISVLATSSIGNTTTDFSVSKPNVAIINRDNNSVLIDSFTEYLETTTNVKKLKDEEETLRDALFYTEVDYILIIPEGYTEDFMNLKNPKIDTMTVPSSYGAKYTEMLLNRFLNISNVYRTAGMDQEIIAKNVKIDLEKNADVIMMNEYDATGLAVASYYYNFTNYTFIAICVYIVGLIINSFNSTNIKRRNLISTFSYKKINIQLFAGNLCLALLIWLLFNIIGLIFYPEVMMSSHGLLLMINFLAFSITALSIGFLIGNLVKSREAMDGIVNVLALGSSFICGAFVPQELLGDFVISISKVLPSYWFIKNNNDIANLSSFDFNSLQPIFINMLIVLAFGLAFFVITNTVSKLKIKNS